MSAAVEAGPAGPRCAPPGTTAADVTDASMTDVDPTTGLSSLTPAGTASTDERGLERGRLSALAIRGGAYLVGREALGMIVRLAGVVLVVRAIGPGPYGIYTAAAAFVLVVTTLAQGGTEAYLIRLPGEIDRSPYDQAFTYLFVASAVGTLAALGLSFAVAPLLRPVGVVLPLRVLLLSIPINVLWAPAQAKIERRFGYRQMGILELGGDVALYGTAVPLAYFHFGEWSLVYGTFAWQSWLLVGSLVFAGLRPRWNWSTPAMRAMLRHGFGYSSATWANRLTGVVNALVVGSFAGAVGVGFVSFAANLVTTIGFAARGAYRLGMVALSKVPDRDRSRLRYAIEEGSSLQLAALAVPFAAFGVVARWLVPLLFGQQWKGAIPVYCLLALAAMLNAPSVIQCTFLLARGKNLRVAVVGVISTSVLVVTSIVLVEHFGTVGFGIATLIALIDTVYSDRMVRRVTDFGYRTFGILTVALAPPVLFPLVPMPYGLLLLLPLALLVVVPTMRHEMVRLAHVVSGSIRMARA
jgi:O-antigen/teichoic acid export membrane protein